MPQASRIRDSTAPTASQMSQRRPIAVPLLPDHEPLKYRLKQDTISSLEQIQRHNNNQDLKYLESQLNAAIQLLTECAGEINELVATRQEDAKRSTQTSEIPDEAEVQELEDEVEKLTSRMEEHVRKTIDNMQELGNVKSSTQNVIDAAKRSLVSSLSHSHQARGRAVEDGDDEITEANNTTLSQIAAPDPETTPTTLFAAQLSSTRDAYQLQSLRLRYSEHPSYVEFKQIVHETKYGDETELPHPSTWFPSSRQGSPLIGTQHDVNGAEDSDDDLQMMRVKISTKCPLSLTEMEQPTSNRACQHVFEKSAIEAYLKAPVERGRRQREGKTCPVPGCEKNIRMDDLFVDQAIVRKIRRIQGAKKKENTRDMEVDDQDDEEEGEEHIGWNNVNEGADSDVDMSN